MDGVPADGANPAVRVSGDLIAGGNVAVFVPTEDGARLIYRADEGVNELGHTGEWSSGAP